MVGAGRGLGVLPGEAVGGLPGVRKVSLVVGGCGLQGGRTRGLELDEYQTFRQLFASAPFLHPSKGEEMKTWSTCLIAYLASFHFSQS